VKHDSRQVPERDDLEPLWPSAVGVAHPRPRIEDIEGERLLENEARARLEADGFTDAQILGWVGAFFAARHAGEVEDLIEWIHDKEYSESDDTGTDADSPTNRS
jgi:hypothetical protein